MTLSHDFVWDDLLEYLDDRRVIPIIGWDLLQTPAEPQPLRFDRLVAARMAQKLNLPTPAETSVDPLDELVRSYEATGGHADQLYPRLRSVLRDKFETPE